MTIRNDIQTYSIIPFDRHRQADIDDLMTEIQKEFETTFTSPRLKSITDLVGEGNTFWVAVNQNKVIGTWFNMFR